MRRNRERGSEVRNARSRGRRRTLGADRATPATTKAAMPLSGSRATRRPQGAERDPVRALDGDRVAAAAAEARLRLRHDLLASPPRLAKGRRLRASLRVFLCIGGWLGVVGYAVSEVDAQDGHGGRPVVTGAPVRLGALDGEPDQP